MIFRGSIVAIAILCWASPAYARDKASAPVTFSDGALGTVSKECGLGDLCASLRLSNGDVVSIYNGGAPHCQPYTLNVVRTHGDTVLFNSRMGSDDVSSSSLYMGSRRKGACYAFKSTFLTFDAGIAHLGLFQSHDGALFGEWSGDIPSPSPEASSPASKL